MPGAELVQSVTRSLDLLEHVAHAEAGLTLQELAEALGVKPPTAHNLARTLLARRYLVKSERPVRYRLGPAALTLAVAFSSRAVIDRAAETFGELARRFAPVTWSLTEAVGSEVVMVLRAGPERPGFCERPRRVMHPYGSASAVLFQAFWSDEERRAYRQAHPFWEYGAHVWRTEEEFDRLLAEVRRTGRAEPVFRAEDAHLLAVPVFGPTGELVAAAGARLPREATGVDWAAAVAGLETAARRWLTVGATQGATPC